MRNMRRFAGWKNKESSENMNPTSRDLERFMAGSLSPRKSAPQGIPARPSTHYRGSYGMPVYGSYGMPVNYVGALDLHTPNYTYATGQQRPVNNFAAYGAPLLERRPMHQHQSRSRQSVDYLHNAGIFQTTNPGNRGHYVINPDWVSEKFTMRRSKSMLTL